VKMSIGSLWVRFVSIISLVLTVVGLYFAWGLPLDIVLGSTTLPLVIFIIVAISLNISPYLVSIDRTLKDIREMLKGRSDQKASLNPNNPESKEEEEVKTTGGGVLVGMAVGGLIGLIGGPIGVIIGGLIGALVGNQLEYESIKAEREKKKVKQT